MRELPQHEHTQIMESAQRRNKKNTGDYKITAATEAAQNLQDISDLIVRSARTKEPFAYCAVYIETGAILPIIRLHQLFHTKNIATGIRCI